MFGHSAWDPTVKYSERRSSKRISKGYKAEGDDIIGGSPDKSSSQRRAKAGSITDCKVSEWSDWEVSNDGCIEIRTRKVVREPTCGGKECPILVEERPVGATDSVWGWSEWTSDPNDPCFEIRKRIMRSPATCGGNPNDPLLS